MNRERQSPGRLFFLLAAKERTKENCRCFDAADPRLGGCTPPRPPKRKSEGEGAKRKQYYFSFLTPPPLPPPLSRGFPRTPAGGGRRPPCQRGLSPLGDWGIPTGYALQPVPGQPPHTAKGRAAALPRPSRPQPIHATLPLPLLYSLHRREGS